MRRGPLYMILAGLMFTVMVSMVKHVRADMAAMDVIVWRGLAAIPLAWLFARTVGLRVHNKPLLVLRALLGFGAMIGYFTAAKGLLVADLSLIGKLHPILVALGAGWLLGASERPGPRLWLVLIGGVAGCALILAPDLAVGSVYGLYCLGATISSAAAHLCIRALMRTDDSRVIVLYFQCIGSSMALVYILASTGAMPVLPPLELMPYLVGIGVTATFGQMLMTQAYKEDRAVVVSAARYSEPLWALLADIIIFATLPGWNVFVGGAVIIGAGLFLLLASAPRQESG